MNPEAPRAADSPLSAEEAANKYAIRRHGEFTQLSAVGLIKTRGAFLAGDANGYARAQAEAKEEIAALKTKNAQLMSKLSQFLGDA